MDSALGRFAAGTSLSLIPIQSLNHLVPAQHQRLRDRDAEGLASFVIEKELKFDRLRPRATSTKAGQIEIGQPGSFNSGKK